MNQLFRPLHDYIWVDPIVLPEQNKSGLYLGHTTELSAPTRAMVILAGPGKRNEKGELIEMPVLTTGDVVVFAKGTLQKLSARNPADRKEEPMYVIRADDIIGVEEV